METNSFSEIKTERLLLRTLKKSDWQEISFLRSNELVNKFVDRPKAETKEKALLFIDKITNGNVTNEWYFWAIALKTDPILIGTICLWNFSEDKKSAEVGFDLHPNFQQKGIMTEALLRVIQFGFTNLALTKIEAFTNQKNNSSIQLLTKNNFKLTVNRLDKSNADMLNFKLSK